MRCLRVRCLAFLLVILMLVPTTVVHAADEVLDQAAENPIGAGAVIAHDESGNAAIAQTLTAGVSGMLTSVELFLFPELPTTVTLSLHPAEIASGLPVEPALASVSLPPEVQTAFTWYRFTFAEPVPITRGARYALVLAILPPAEGESGWAFETGDYAGGESMRQRYAGSEWIIGQWDAGDLFDFAFRTYVIPEQTPDAATMLRATRDIVWEMGLHPGITKSLVAKLTAALAAHERGADATACQQLSALLNQVNAQRGKALTTAQADVLTHDVQAIREHLACR